MLDSKRKFNLAAWEYYKLSNMDLAQEDIVAQLSSAMTCAILSPAGDSKYRIMSVLHKDERTKAIDPHYGILDKLFMGHIIKESDVAAYEADVLTDHQKARGEDGSTVLARALLEHNILVLSKVYLNITFESLGKFLNITTEKAERIISDMVRENRIQAQLDQMTNTIDFEVQIGGKAV